MKKKQWMALLLALALLMALSACAKTPEKNSGETTAPVEETKKPAEETEKPSEETPPENADAEPKGPCLRFTTTDVYGETVTSEALFGGNKYTMINCWTSWCPPCIGELSELEALSKLFEEKGCGLVGLLYDGDDPAGLADALDIMSEKGVSYTNVIPWEGVDDLLQIQAVPTSFFVDSEGNIVGEFIVGADPEGYEAMLNQLLGE